MPSIVVTWAPSAWAARTVHDFTASPFRWKVHAPQLDVSQPTWVPVNPRWSRRKCTSSRRGSTSAVCCSPFTVIETLTGVAIRRFSSRSDAACPQPSHRLLALSPPDAAGGARALPAGPVLQPVPPAHRGGGELAERRREARAVALGARAAQRLERRGEHCGPGRAARAQ